MAVGGSGQPFLGSSKEERAVIASLARFGLQAPYLGPEPGNPNQYVRLKRRLKNAVMRQLGLSSRQWVRWRRKHGRYLHAD